VALTPLMELAVGGLRVTGVLSLALASSCMDSRPASGNDYPIGYGPAPRLAEPVQRESLHTSTVVGWQPGHTPVGLPGFSVALYAEIESPRWLYVLPGGAILVAQSSFSQDVFSASDLTPESMAALRGAGLLRASPNRVTLLRDADKDGRPEVRQTVVEGLDHPFGMALLDSNLYVAATNGIWRFPFATSALEVRGRGEKVVDLPAGPPNPHWTRNLVASPDGTRLYVTVGSATNVDEEGIDARDPRRATILEVDPRGGTARVFATGLRNATGMDWAVGTSALWTVVNERDHLGPDLPPDFLTSVREGGFYGWPFAYFGRHEDPRRAGERPDLVARAIQPDYALGAHTAPVGLVFYRDTAFPPEYHGGAFISLHGSSRRTSLAGYSVIFVPFHRGSPAGAPRVFLGGFVADSGRREVYGRPMGLAVLPDGSLLVADDAGDRIWRVRQQ
jgi:glucose/arabinose dehydrogenase